MTVTADPRHARFKQVTDSLELKPVPESCWPDLKALFAEMERREASRFRLEWGPEKDPIALRVQRRDTPNYRVYVARRINALLLPVNQLGIAPVILDKLQSPTLRAGGVIFCGRPGAGKTTAACSLIVERLVNIGGFTWTAENPVEYDLQKAIEKKPACRGQCYQEEVNADEDISRSLSDTLRSGADTFYVGEIREEKAATAACLAASSGMLVISTLHADSIKEAITKMGALVGFAALAASIRAILAVRLEHRPAGLPGPSKILHVDPLFIETDSLRMMIRDQNMPALTQAIASQPGQLLSARTAQKGRS